MSWHKDLACSLPRGWSSQPRSSWCSPSADVAPPVTEGLEPGKRRGAPSRIFKGLNPELWCCFSCYLALQAVMFQGHLRFLWLIFPDAWTFFSLPINFQKSTMTLVFLPWEAWANGFSQITSKLFLFDFCHFLPHQKGDPSFKQQNSCTKGISKPTLFPPLGCQIPVSGLSGKCCNH